MQNYFEKFSLPIKFEIDLDDLEQKYFSFQQLFHPDKAGIAEIENSILINEAYENLKDPIKRATYILFLNNIDISDNKNAVKPDISTLKEILEIQEKIIDLSPEEISVLKKSIDKKIKILFDQLAENLENKDLANAAQILIKIKYFNKTLRDLRK